MRLLLPSLLAVLIGASAGAALAGSNQACRPQALSALRAESPGGLAIYQRIGQPAFFRSWIDCDASQYDLPTAVHESVHFIASDTDAFPLVGGGAIARPHEVSDFFPPYRIADRFAADDFTNIYLTRGKASSATDFLYLLDEFDAYTHDLDAAVALRGLSTADLAVDHRDGLAAMMAFLAAYADAAQAGEPDTWAGLRQPPAAKTISALWDRAERVLASSCGIPNFGTSDKAYIRRVCEAGPGSAIAQIIGRAPVCPAACLEPTSGTNDKADEAEVALDAPQSASPMLGASDDDPTGSTRTRHPFAGNAGPRRHRSQYDEE